MAAKARYQKGGSSLAKIGNLVCVHMFLRMYMSQSQSMLGFVNTNTNVAEEMALRAVIFSGPVSSPAPEFFQKAYSGSSR